MGSATTSTTAVNGVVSGGSFNIDDSNMPAHRHSVGGVVTSTSNFDTPTYGNESGTNKEVCRAVINTSTVNSSYVGGSGAIGSNEAVAPYYQPYTVVNYIIKY